MLQGCLRPRRSACVRVILYVCFVRISNSPLPLRIQLSFVSYKQLQATAFYSVMYSDVCFCDSGVLLLTRLRLGSFADPHWATAQPVLCLLSQLSWVAAVLGQVLPVGEQGDNVQQPCYAQPLHGAAAYSCSFIKRNDAAVRLACNLTASACSACRCMADPCAR
jgi:hypothetical protein